MTDPDQSIDPADMLLALIVTLLAPMFLGITGGNLFHARLAALDTINGYRSRNQADLLAIGLIIAFGLTALSSLSQSLEDGVSTRMALRLRGNANALNRSAEQNRQALRQNLGQTLPPPTLAAAEPEPDAQPEPPMPDEIDQILAADSAARLLPNPPKRVNDMWAAAMVREADKITASLATLPAAERAAAKLRADTLSGTAQTLAPAQPKIP